MSDFHEFEDWASGILRGMERPARNRLLRRMAHALRRANVQRIAGQVDPDGQAFAPRKAQAQPRIRNRPGAIRRSAEGPMFQKIRTNAHLKLGLDGEGAWVGFVGRVARIARVHQEGLEDRVSRDGPNAQYPERRLLGISDQDSEALMALFMEHFDA